MLGSYVLLTLTEEVGEEGVGERIMTSAGLGLQSGVESRDVEGYEMLVVVIKAELSFVKIAPGILQSVRFLSPTIRWPLHCEIKGVQLLSLLAKASPPVHLECCSLSFSRAKRSFFHLIFSLSVKIVRIKC